MAGTGPGRRRSQHGGAGGAVRHARQSRRAEAVALRADDPAETGTRLLSAEASFMVMDMLGQPVAPMAAPPAARPPSPGKREPPGDFATPGRRDFRALCARRLDRQFRRRRQSGLCRHRRGGAAVFPDRRRDRGRTSAPSPGRNGGRPSDLNTWRFAWRAATSQSLVSAKRFDLVHSRQIADPRERCASPGYDRRYDRIGRLPALRE